MSLKMLSVCLSSIKSVILMFFNSTLISSDKKCDAFFRPKQSQDVKFGSDAAMSDAMAIFWHKNCFSCLVINFAKIEID